MKCSSSKEKQSARNAHTKVIMLCLCSRCRALMFLMNTEENKVSVSLLGGNKVLVN